MTSPGLVVAGTAVILTGDAARAALQAVLIAIRSRRLSGLPNSAAYTELAQALADAATADGQSDVPKHAVGQGFPAEVPTVPIDDAAARLGLSPRQVRRLAPKLGGRIIGGRWLLDEQAIREHLQGKKQ